MPDSAPTGDYWDVIDRNLAIAGEDHGALNVIAVLDGVPSVGLHPIHEPHFILTSTTK